MSNTQKIINHIQSSSHPAFFSVENWGFYVCAFDPRTLFSPPPRQDGQKMPGQAQRWRCGWWKKGRPTKMGWDFYEFEDLDCENLGVFQVFFPRLHNLILVELIKCDRRCHSDVVSQSITCRSQQRKVLWRCARFIPAMTERIDFSSLAIYWCLHEYSQNCVFVTLGGFLNEEDCDVLTCFCSGMKQNGSYRLGRSLFDWGVTSSRSRKDGQRESLDERHGQALQAHGRWPSAILIYANDEINFWRTNATKRGPTLGEQKGQLMVWLHDFAVIIYGDPYLFQFQCRMCFGTLFLPGLLSGFGSIHGDFWILQCDERSLYQPYRQWIADALALHWQQLGKSWKVVLLKKNHWIQSSMSENPWSSRLFWCLFTWCIQYVSMMYLWNVFSIYDASTIHSQLFCWVKDAKWNWIEESSHSTQVHLKSEQTNMKGCQNPALGMAKLLDCCFHGTQSRVKAPPKTNVEPKQLFIQTQIKVLKNDNISISKQKTFPLFLLKAASFFAPVSPPFAHCQPHETIFCRGWQWSCDLWTIFEDLQTQTLRKARIFSCEILWELFGSFFGGYQCVYQILYTIYKDTHFNMNDFARFRSCLKLPWFISVPLIATNLIK